MFDAIIVGGGPAGLSAALILGRSLRKVLVCDSGRQRNAWSHGIHGFLSRDGVDPSDFLSICHEELKKYPSVKFFACEVTEAKKQEGCFEIVTSEGATFHSKKLLLATGVVDCIPKIDGIMSLYGKSVHNCPYCDGWEERGKKIAVYGKGDRGKKLSLSLKNWSEDVILVTDGPSGLSDDDRELLKLNDIQICEEKITCLHGENGQLEKIEFASGNSLNRDCMFFNTESFIRSRLLDQLGCPYTEHEGVEAGKYEKTDVPGLYVAGNILREVQMVIVAAAQGAEAAFGINSALTKESINWPQQSNLRNAEETNRFQQSDRDH